jgi:hypothetical protein
MKETDDYQLDYLLESNNVSSNCTSPEELFTLYEKTDGLKIFHINIRGINKHFDELLALLQDSKVTFDLIILTETQLKHDTDQISLNGYTTLNFTNKTTTHDGLTIISNDKSLDSINITHNKAFSEANVASISLSKNSEKYSILAIYRSPSGDIKTFCNELEIELKSMVPGHKVVIGDININTLDNSANSAAYINILNAKGFTQCIDKPTRVTTSTKSCIDHIFTNPKNSTMKASSTILETSITDHYATCIGWKTKTIRKHDKNTCNAAPQVTNKEITKIDYELLIKNLEKQDWDVILNETDTNVAAETLVTVFQNHIRDATKTKTIKFKNHYKIKPWITQGIIKSIRNRDKIHKKVIQNPNNYVLKDYYKTYRNCLNILIKKTKNDYYKDKLIKAQGDPKQVWAVINECTNKQLKPNVIKQIQTAEGMMSVDKNPKEIADTFVNFFSDVGETMAENIAKEQNLNRKHTDCVEKPNSRIHSKTIFMSPVSASEISKYINELKTFTACGPDLIPTIAVKRAKQHIILPLLHIINLSLETGIYPDIFKTAHIKPIFKKGNKTQANNYRPISLLSIFSKLLEKCIKNRICNFLEENNLLSKNQFGFRSQIGTEEAILKVTTKIYSSIDINDKPLAIFLDLAKAFDTVSHPILLQKLHNIGIRGITLDLISSYLRERKQFVKINDTLSNPRTIKYGVPQGTVLGPLLFLIFINDLCSLLENCDTTTFADDTVIIFSSKSWELTHQLAETGLNVVKKWLNSNLLTLNNDKTMYITFSPRTNSQPLNSVIKIHKPTCHLSIPNCDCYIVEKAHSTRYLGIIVDQHLKWNEHIQNIIKKLRYVIATFYNVRNILSPSNLKLLYYALVQSTIQYGIAGWGGTYDKHLQPLLVIQNLLLKLTITKEARPSTEFLYEYSGVLQVRKLYALSVIKSIHYNKTNLPSNKNINYQITTRAKSKKNFYHHRANKGISQRHIHYLGFRLYNAVPCNIRKAFSKRTFNYGIKKWLGSLKTASLNSFINLKSTNLT